MESGAGEVEAAEAQAAVEEEAPGVSESAVEDLEAEAADPARWGIDRSRNALEADQRLTAGYEKVKGKAFDKAENAWLTSFCS